MTAYVIDTNVPIVANGKSIQASHECVIECLECLTEAMHSIVCIDSGLLVLDEYMRHLSLSGQPGAGDYFMKWVHQNQAVVDCVERVAITPTQNNSPSFEEFPDDGDLGEFDLSDRKFVAIAIGSKHSPSVVNATDSDWWENREALQRNGVVVRFLCPELFL